MSSKIKVDTIENVAGSGNVSLGSGHNLVVPGNNSTTGNATVGGTLGVTGKTTLSDNVGIGVTTETDWHANNEVLQLGLGACIYGNNTATENQILSNAKGTLGSSLNGYKYINADKASTYQQYDGQHNFRVAGAGSADAAITWNTAMTIDNSGRVTKPLTPFVRLSLTSHVSPSSTVNAPGNQVTGFTVRENVGNYWNSSNNNFTCPVAGVYQVSVFYIKYPASGTAHLDLHKNGSIVNEVRWRAPEAGNHYYQAGGTASVTCAANDVLDWHYFGGAGIHDGNGSWEIMLSH